MYLFELPGWPSFTWKRANISNCLMNVRRKHLAFVMRMEALDKSTRKEIILQTLTVDVEKSAQIEEERLSRKQIRSSVAHRLGLDITGVVSSDKNVDGFVSLMLDASQRYFVPLTKERLFKWHEWLLPMEQTAIKRIKVGAWRDDAEGPMQIVSGPIGREKTHFQAPPADHIEEEMSAFLTWFNLFDDTDPVLRAAIAHLWFVTIHPFSDGNGRIARAISDMILARSEFSGRRYYSMSAQIYQDRDSYYKMLEDAQKGALDITEALKWFIGCLDRAIDAAEVKADQIHAKVQLFNSSAIEALNERQLLIIDKLFENFKGNLTTSKWAKIAKCSQEKAVSDIEDLVARGILVEDQAKSNVISYVLTKKA